MRFDASLNLFLVSERLMEDFLSEDSIPWLPTVLRIKTIKFKYFKILQRISAKNHNARNKTLQHYSILCVR